MKKFGTPVGPVPGSENENVELDPVDVPPLVPVPLPFFFFGFELFLGLAAGFFLLEPLLDPGLRVFGWGREDGRCRLPGCVACGAVCVLDVDVDVDVDVVLDVEVGLVVVEVVLDVEVGLDVVDDVVVGLNVVVLVVELVVLVGVHVIDSAVPAIGSWIWSSGVPGGTLRSSVVVPPPAGSATTTAQSSASATGSIATACTTSTVATVASATLSFLLLNTVTYLLPPSRVRGWAAPSPRRSSDWTLSTGIGLCNAEPSVKRSCRRHTAPQAP